MSQRLSQVYLTLSLPDFQLISSVVRGLQPFEFKYLIVRHLCAYLLIKLDRVRFNFALISFSLSFLSMDQLHNLELIVDLLLRHGLIKR